MGKEFAPYQLHKGGQVRNVEVRVYVNGEYTDLKQWDCTLWVERGEDWYAFMNTSYRNKRVRVVERERYIRAEVIESK